MSPDRKSPSYDYQNETLSDILSSSTRLPSKPMTSSTDGEGFNDYLFWGYLMIKDNGIRTIKLIQFVWYEYLKTILTFIFNRGLSANLPFSRTNCSVRDNLISEEKKNSNLCAGNLWILEVVQPED